MAKTRKHKAHDGPPAKKSKKMHTFAKLSTSSKLTNSAANNNHTPGGKKGQSQSQSQSQGKQQQKQQRRPVIPFGRRDRVLLVGEGDFSFARSLVHQYKCRSVLATSYDSQETLHEKYPHVEGNIRAILNPRQRPKETRVETTEENTSQSGSSHEQEEDQTNKTNPNTPRILYSIDARKLGSTGGGGKEVRNGFPRRKRTSWKQHRQQTQSTQPASSEGGPWDIICFNFPHVGGISTDVNRQVRSNQELLVGFFKACVPLLSNPEVGDDMSEDEEDYDFESGFDSDSDGNTGSGRRTEPGQILVTLFEGEPYTLWNVKDLARHAGLRVVTSFRFPWSSYEGYSHARTLGEVEGKHGGRGGWRGEDREARMYVFENAQAPRRAEGNGKQKKRGRNDSDSDSD